VNYIEIFWESGAVKYSQLSLRFSDHQSEPILVKKPKLTRSLLFNYSIENSTFYFELSENETLNEKIQEETILGTKIQYWKWNGPCLFTGYISEFPKTESKKISFKADIFKKLESSPNKVIDADEFPNAGENLGKYSNIILGNESAGMYAARKVDTGKYLCAWNSLSLITSASTKNGTGIYSEISTDIDPVKGYTYILYSSEDSIIYFNGKGPEDQGNLIENPASMLHYLLSNFSDFTEEDLSEAETIYDDRDYNGNFFFINDQSTWIDIFKFFSLSYNCRIINTKQGKIKIKVIKWIDETPLFSLDESNVKNFQKRKETKFLKKAFSRMYQFDPQSKQYKMTPMDLISEMSYSQQTGELQQKFIIDDSVSLDAGTRYTYIIGKPVYIYSAEIPENLIVQCELGNTVEILHRDSYFPGQYRLVQILRIQSPENSGLYKIEGNDINEIKGTPMIIREAGDPQNPILYEAGNSKNPKIWWSN
jgi:hypothetical protein